MWTNNVSEIMLEQGRNKVGWQMLVLMMLEQLLFGNVGSNDSGLMLEII